MAEEPKRSSDKLADLATRLDRFEQATAPKEQRQRTPSKPVFPPTSPREKIVRRWILSAFVGWGLLIYGVAVVQRWGEASPWELIFGFLFVMVVALLSYVVQIFYWELGKGVWRWFRRCR